MSGQNSAPLRQIPVKLPTDTVADLGIFHLSRRPCFTFLPLSGAVASRQRLLLPCNFQEAPPTARRTRHLKPAPPPGRYSFGCAAAEPSRDSKTLVHICCISSVNMAQVNTCLKRTFTVFNIFFAVSLMSVKPKNGRRLSRSFLRIKSAQFLRCGASARRDLKLGSSELSHFRLQVYNSSHNFIDSSS